MQRGGNVGIGTDSPDCKLDVVSTSNSFPNTLQVQYNGSPTGDVELLSLINRPTNTHATVFPNYSFVVSDIYGNTGIGNQKFAIGYRANNSSSTVRQDRLVIDASGNVGIGTHNPGFKVQISGSAAYNGYTDNLYAYHHSGSSWNHHSGTNWPHANYPGHNNDVGLRVDEGIICKRQYIMSDIRIKKDIIEIEDDIALQKLRLLKPCRYKYIENDTDKRNDEVIGFIAQEVGKVLPRAITKQKAYIPDILVCGKITLADASGCVITIEQEHNLIVGDIIKCKDNEDTEIDNITVLEVINSTAIRVDKVFNTEQTTVTDKDGFTEDDIIFVYGKQIDDFHNLDKNVIWTIATAALQQVDKNVVAHEAKIAGLESQMAKILNRLTALEN